MSNSHGMGWRERWAGWRNGIIASPRFQQLAARLWLTRPVARMRARRLFDVVAGFTYSQTLAAWVSADLFALLRERARTTAEIAAHADLPLAAADRLVRAGTALGLAERVAEDRWALGGEGAALCGNPGIVEMVAHHHLLYADLSDPLAALRRGPGGGALAAFWHYAEDSGQGSPDQVAPYSRLMAASQPMVQSQIIRGYRFARHRRIMDIGGGEGAFVAAVAHATPGPDLTLFDLPAVVARAQARFDSQGLASRISTKGGNFLADALPQGHDLITLVRVLHDHDDAPAQKLLRSIFDALTPGGRLLIAEPMAEVRGAEGAGDAYFGWYLWAMGSGRPRSAATIKAMLKAAGFRRIRLVSTDIPLTVRMILAER